MKITTKDIIKILPFDNEFKNELLGSFDGLDDDKKFNIGEVLWNAYDAFYELKLKENTQLALLQARDNQEKLDKDFYKRIREQTDKEMEQEATQMTAQVDLAQTREELKEIINKPSNP